LKECDKCQGTGWVIIEKEGREFALRCVCQAGELQIQRLKAAGVPERFMGARLDNFHENNDSLKKAKSKVRSFIDQYPANINGLLLAGPTGVGKTRLLCTIANELLAKGFEQINYLDWNQFVLAFRSFSAQRSEEEISRDDLIETACRSELLLFDEFFATLPESGWVREQLLEAVSHIVNQRYNDLKKTVLATNYLREHRGGAQHTLEEILGVRLFSKISEMTDYLEIGSFDFRKKYG
jgi:DNA replication protein DnaC